MTSTATSPDTSTRWVGDDTGRLRPGATTMRDSLQRTAPAAPVRVDPLLRQGNAFYIGVHGLLHLAAAAVAWGSISLGLPMITIPALSPALAASALATLGIAFLGCAVLLAIGRGWRAALIATTALSTLACLVSLPEAAIALGVNGLIALGLLASRPRT